MSRWRWRFGVLLPASELVMNVMELTPAKPRSCNNAFPVVWATANTLNGAVAVARTHVRL